jgi:hypothetical protein
MVQSVLMHTIGKLIETLHNITYRPPSGHLASGKGPECDPDGA